MFLKHMSSQLFFLIDEDSWSEMFASFLRPHILLRVVNSGWLGQRQNVYSYVSSLKPGINSTERHEIMTYFLCSD